MRIPAALRIDTGRVNVAKFLSIIGLVILLVACSDPAVSINARIGDFLDDLRDENYGSTIERHFHSNVTTDVRAAETWQGSNFRSGESSGYSWNESSRSEVSDYSGSTRVSGILTIELDSDIDDDTANIVFFMKTQDGDWMIRAINDGGEGDGILIESWHQP